MARRFMQFTSDFSGHFIPRGRDVSHHAKCYLSGLLGTLRRKNIGRIDEDVAGSNYQSMQQLISDSSWCDKELFNHIARDVNGLLGGHPKSALYIDESSFVKQGRASVGVKRQYCGRLGKVENCQVGVFGCLGRGDRAGLVDARLFLPEDWCADAERCAKAKVPESARAHRAKPQLALEIVRGAVARGLEFAWVGGDALYGNCRDLTDGIEDLGRVFLMDINPATLVYTHCPQPQARKEEKEKGARKEGSRKGDARKASGRRGRPERRMKSGLEKAHRVSLKAFCERDFANASRVVEVRDGLKGKIKARVLIARCWQWEAGDRVRERLAVVRQEEDGSYKYSLTNAAADTPWETLAYMQAQRYWIERAFEDAKSELGMAQYEVRSWRGWHHHMALVCLAALFVLKERLVAAPETPLLSARDVVELLAHYLPRRNRTEEGVLMALEQRHYLRAKDIARRRKLEGVV